jgi:nucleoid DNA-binding protein
MARTTRKKGKKTSKKPAAGAAKKSAKINGATGKPRTKGEIFSLLAENNDLSRKQVAGVFETLGKILEADLQKGKAGVVNVGGLMKVTVQRKPATKARKGINPFTKEETIFKAKPARNVVRVRPLKALKDLV